MFPVNLLDTATVNEMLRLPIVAATLGIKKLRRAVELSTSCMEILDCSLL
jgi:hypothetical protein